MKLSEVKNKLQSIESLEFQLPNGSLVPNHFHITEVGAVSKDFIDCGGKVRHEKVVNFQFWQANDTDHRLGPQKLLSIIVLAEKALGLGDWDVEVEYQGETIGKYGMEAENERFLLTSTYTACLASDTCGTQQNKKKVLLSDIRGESTCCTPGGGCC